MVKQKFFILIIIFLAGKLGAQPVVFINAGSRAPYGTTQELTIQANGQCLYYLKEVNGPVKDSSRFSISRSQLDSFFAKAQDLGFFALLNKYDGGVMDGAGIYMSMNHNGLKKRVDVRNSNQSVINSLVEWLNDRMAIHQVRIYYGQTK